MITLWQEHSKNFPKKAKIVEVHRKYKLYNARKYKCSNVSKYLSIYSIYCIKSLKVIYEWNTTITGKYSI